jgi:imidazolonepropionase
MTGQYLTGIGQLTTNLTTGAIPNAVVVVDDGVVTYAGPAGHGPALADRMLLDCGGRAVIPGFVDAHTHLVFAGDRSSEFRRRMAGESYTEIAATGGGIKATVEATRHASADRLFQLAADRVERMITAGTTTLEIKSGYGLDTATETMLLQVARRIGAELPVTVRTTFLGAHTVPPEYQGDRDGYVGLIIDEMLPAASGLADFCDVFVEDGAFSVDEARIILTAAKDHGLGVRVHAEQLGHSGGAMLAAELGAASADHLDHATPEDATALATAGVAAVLVPGASYMMRTSQAPGPMLWDAGCVVALATDCNPGTSYLEGMGLAISLAVVQMGLTVEQALWAATRGGALSLGLDDRGTIIEGAIADLIVLDAPNHDHIPYRPASNLAWATLRHGQWSHRVQ